MTAAGDFLQQMAKGSRERVDAAKRGRSEAALLEVAQSTAPPPMLRPNAARFDLIAELKLRSPAVGQLKSAGDEDVAERVNTYARAGAAAVSVLTEPSRFDGSMTHLEIAAQALAPLRVPAMRKDFLVDPYQVIEARAAGAGGVLVIVRMMSRSQIGEMLACAHKLGLFVLLEAFDEPDIEVMHAVLATHDADRASRAGQPASAQAGRTASAQAGQSASARVPVAVPAPPSSPPVLAGLNCRDLATLQIVPERLAQLAHLLPTNIPRVAESGVASPDDAGRMAEAGYEYILVGSALMQGGNPHALAAAMLEAGRARRPK